MPPWCWAEFGWKLFIMGAGLIAYAAVCGLWLLLFGVLPLLRPPPRLNWFCWGILFAAATAAFTSFVRFVLPCRELCCSLFD